MTTVHAELSLLRLTTVSETARSLLCAAASNSAARSGGRGVAVTPRQHVS